ncbi:hypothetical protein [Cellulomonas denverensis]|uniref:YCII-related domain-containing protein n=1 Tax=Cellulomonas denverensis TaxID=264297 RepID=A0A7X6QXR4_9CELL|nr:hypothetical protein [Cellulomonas denverensis]NKY21354.1 hypothetical protein [Cellulomonas denverensis]GIG27324.1 hypothetical protein Cde04nite_35680 [Cellulomonas denverensis]
MPDYVAHLTVAAVPDDETRAGMADALGALRDDAPPGFTGPGVVVFDLRGEAPDQATAERVARAHAAEVLDGWPHEVEVEVLGG